MTETDDLTISIGTLDSFDMLSNCLDSIVRNTSPSLRYSIWIVYNGSGDTDVPDRIEREYPQARLIRKQGPLGYCATHNLVLRACRSRYALILDDDTIVHPGTLDSMVAFMDSRPDVGISGCKTLNPDGSFQSTFGLIPDLRSEFSNVFRPAGFWPDRLYRDLDGIREVDWLNGSFMLLRGETIERVGVLDERYYTYVCEADLCHRIRQAGWKVAFVPSASILHIGGQHSINTTAKSRTQILRYHVNRYYFFRKHHSTAAFHGLRILMFMGCAARIARLLVVWLFRPDTRSAAGLKIRAFGRVARLSFARHPDVMPEDA